MFVDLRHPMPKSEHLKYLLPAPEPSRASNDPFSRTAAQSSAITLRVPPFGVPDRLKTSMNDTTVPFLTRWNPGPNFPVKANDTHEDPGSAGAQSPNGAIAIVFPLVLVWFGSAAVPTLAKLIVSACVVATIRNQNSRNNIARMVKRRLSAESMGIPPSV